MGEGGSRVPAIPSVPARSPGPCISVKAPACLHPSASQGCPALRQVSITPSQARQRAVTLLVAHCPVPRPSLSRDVCVIEAGPSLPGGWGGRVGVGRICLLSSSHSFSAFFVPACVCSLPTQQIFIGLSQARDTKATKTRTWEVCWPKGSLLPPPHPAPRSPTSAPRQRPPPRTPGLCGFTVTLMGAHPSSREPWN